MHLVITDGFELNPGDLSWSDINQLGDVSYYESTPKEELIARCRKANVIIVNNEMTGFEVFLRLKKPCLLYKLFYRKINH